MPRAPVTWFVDPADPRAPPLEIWDQMTPEERQRVVDDLPSEFEVTQANPPEGDFHFNPKVAAKETLGGHFQRLGRRVYVACELPIYYPGETMFAPDLVAVLDVEHKERASWTVTTEGKGLDFALEIIWSGNPRKDLEGNVVRYAALGIPEYFVFDRKRLKLRGFRLSPGGRRYLPIVPQDGLLASKVLGLELGLEGDRLRFFHGLAVLQETSELLARLGSMVGNLEARIEEVERHAEEERLRAEAEHERAEEAEMRVEEERLRAEGERLRAEAEHARADDQAARADDQAARADEAERKLAEALAEIERLKRERG